jgi:acetyl esterase/lipase
VTAFSDRLNTAFSRPRTPYRILRPDVVHDAPGVARWLRFHGGGGWLQEDDDKRMEHARRLLFCLYRLYGQPSNFEAIARVDAIGAEQRGGL